MSIISSSYYIGDVQLTDTQIDIVLDSWQETCEEDILKSLMGYELYSLYEADLNGTSEPTEQRFKDLVDGAEFSFVTSLGTVNTKWDGLRVVAKNRSLIAYYVYYQYRNETENFNSGSGQVTSSHENSEKVSVIPKLVNSWNKLVNWYGEIPLDYMCKSFFLNNGNYSHYNIYPSAYNYLLKNLETYPEWVFEPIQKQNIYGI